jgi:hypothetical protein
MRLRKLCKWSGRGKGAKKGREIERESLSPRALFSPLVVKPSVSLRPKTTRRRNSRRPPMSPVTEERGEKGGGRDSEGGGGLFYYISACVAGLLGRQRGKAVKDGKAIIISWGDAGFGQSLSRRSGGFYVHETEEASSSLSLDGCG